MNTRTSKLDQRTPSKIEEIKHVCSQVTGQDQFNRKAFEAEYGFSTSAMTYMSAEKQVECLEIQKRKKMERAIHMNGFLNDKNQIDIAGFIQDNPDVDLDDTKVDSKNNLMVKNPETGELKHANAREKDLMERRSGQCSAGLSTEARFIEDIRLGKTPENVPEFFKDKYEEGMSADELTDMLPEDVKNTQEILSGGIRTPSEVSASLGSLVSEPISNPNERGSVARQIDGLIQTPLAQAANGPSSLSPTFSDRSALGAQEPSVQAPGLRPEQNPSLTNPSPALSMAPTGPTGM